MDIFCNIESQRNSFAIVKENKHAVMIVDINQSYRWHLLIIPKRHTVNISQVDEVTWVEGFAPIIAYGIQQLKKDPEIVGFHLNTNAGSGAHQSVFHTHIHLVPHYKNDNGFKTSFQGSAKPGYQKFEWNLKWETENEIKSSCQRFFHDFRTHFGKKKNDWGLTEGSDGVPENFHLFSRVGQVDGGNYDRCHVHFIPCPTLGVKEFDWMDGFDSKSTSLEERYAVRDQILALSDSEKPTGPPPPTPRPNPSPQPDNPNPENPNPPSPLNHKQVIKKNIAASSNVIQLEDCFRQIVSLPSTQHGEKEEVTKDLANCLEDMIKKVTKLVDLDALEKDCRKAQFYLQNDELREKVNQVCSARRVELGKSTFSPEKSKNGSNNPVMVILLAVLFLSAVLLIGLRRRRNRWNRKVK